MTESSGEIGSDTSPGDSASSVPERESATEGDAVGDDAPQRREPEPDQSERLESEQPEPFDPSISEGELTERLADLGGRLAVGQGPELAVIRPDGTRVEVLDGSESVVAAQPIWSSDGQRLAWSSISATRQIVQIQDFDEDGERSGDPLSSNASGFPIFYLQWNANDDRLAYIRNAPSGGVVEVGHFEPGLPVEPAGEGAPFFVAWSPDRDLLLGHVNESSIDLLDVDGSSDAGAGPGVGFRSIVTVSGGFSAPAWVDEGRALIVSDDRLAYVDTVSGVIEPIVDVGGPVRFVVSPDRTKVAYQPLGGSSGLAQVSVQRSLSGLVVLDLETGDQVTVTEQLAVAWDWSPDSGALAWLRAEVDPAGAVGQWSFWSDEVDLGTTESAPFLITRKYGRSYLPFFAQYAQSVTGWSPDSTAFAFAGSSGSERGVFVQLLTEKVAPRLVAPGDFVTWGSGQSPPSSGDRSAAA